MTESIIHFGDRQIGGDAPCFIIAELSGNHGGSYDRAMEMLSACADAGADAVKVQTFTADSITLKSDSPPFQAEGLWEGSTLYDLYEEASMPWEWQRDMAEEARNLGVKFFSSVFDKPSIEFLDSIGIECFKIASFELVDVGLIRDAASTGKPLIISTGMGTLDEITEAVEAARSGGSGGVALMIATSSYPAPASAANLRRISDLAKIFDVPVGLSDHTLGTDVAVAGTALGAKMVEKHVTLSRDQASVDSEFSLEPSELRSLVEGIRTAEQAIGSAKYGPTDAEASSVSYRRSLFVAKAIEAGSAIQEGDVRSVRPGIGLHTRHLPEVIGRIANRDLHHAEPFSWDMLETLGE